MAEERSSDWNPADLRGILEYVPRFRRKTFVVAFDAAVVEGPGFHELLLDLAVLRSLNLYVVLTYGLGATLKEVSEAIEETPTDFYGTRPVDDFTLDLAQQASGQLAQRLLGGLAESGLKGAVVNFVTGTERGVIDGIDHQHAGKVARVDAESLGQMLPLEVIPIVPPILFDSAGEALRVNSDELAAKLAIELHAEKLIYLLPGEGLIVDGSFQRNIPVEEVAAVLKDSSERIDELARGKARWAVQAIQGGIPRAHIIDGRQADSLLNELFSKVGTGTMIHGNAYQRIRKATTADIPALRRIMQQAVERKELRERSEEDLRQEIAHTFVYEVDGSLIGSMTLRPLSPPSDYEVSAIHIQSFYQGQGAGQKMVEFAMDEAKRLGGQRLFALTTQSFGFFKRTCGFEEVGVDQLPDARRQDWEANGRQSKVLARELR